MEKFSVSTMRTTPTTAAGHHGDAGLSLATVSCAHYVLATLMLHSRRLASALAEPSSPTTGSHARPSQVQDEADDNDDAGPVAFELPGAFDVNPFVMLAAAPPPPDFLVHRNRREAALHLAMAWIALHFARLQRRSVLGASQAPTAARRAAPCIARVLSRLFRGRPIAKNRGLRTLWATLAAWSSLEIAHFLYRLVANHESQRTAGIRARWRERPPGPWDTAVSQLQANADPQVAHADCAICLGTIADAEDSAGTDAESATGRNDASGTESDTAATSDTSGMPPLRSATAANHAAKRYRPRWLAYRPTESDAELVCPCPTRKHWCHRHCLLAYLAAVAAQRMAQHIHPLADPPLIVRCATCRAPLDLPLDRPGDSHGISSGSGGSGDGRPAARLISEWGKRLAGFARILGSPDGWKATAQTWSWRHSVRRGSLALGCALFATAHFSFHEAVTADLPAETAALPDPLDAFELLG